MSAPAIAAIGLVDRERIVGTAGVDKAWRDLGSAPPGNGRTFRAVFGRGDETFRRLDVASRVLVLAGAAAGLDVVLPAAVRDDTALVVATTVGCLDADRQFAHSLGAEMLAAPVFPYTLPSTCLGELALRHGLRGAGVCLSVAPGDGAQAFAEGARLLAAGEAAAAVVAWVDVLRDDPVNCDAALALLAPPGLGLRAVAAWPADPARVRSALRAACG
ncbi:MAG: hypothetical protein KF830_15670 [Planctomycetes bacterium]|nr:hypothetical protein [Planctomycetota bacterium]